MRVHSFAACLTIPWPPTATFADKVNVCLVVVTTLYLIVTTCIWLTAKRSLKLAFLDLRPWVTTGSFGKEGHAIKVDPGTRTVFSTDMKNVGRTPAFISKAGTITNVYRAVPQQVPALPPGSAPVLAPGDERELAVIIPAIQPAHLSQIGSALHLIAFVVIEYADSQGRRHKTVSAHELVQYPGTQTFRWQDLPEHGEMS